MEDKKIVICYPLPSILNDYLQLGFFNDPIEVDLSIGGLSVNHFWCVNRFFGAA